MRGALIGFGTVAQAHLSAYRRMPDVMIEAVMDPVESRRQLAARLSPGIATYDNVAELLRNETPDFLDICSPPNTHHEYVLAGLSGRCHVLCEKPLLLAPEHYRGLLPLARSAGRVVYPCHNYKFSPAAKVLSQAIRRREIGDLLSGRFQTLRTGHAVGVPEWNPHWRLDPHIAGGGILYDHGTHNLYLASHLTGRRPRAVSCVFVNSNGSANGYAEEAGELLVDMGDLRWMIEMSWVAEERKTSYTVVGSEGSIAVDDSSVRRTTVGGGATVERLASGFNDPSHQEWFEGMFDDFNATIADADRQYPILAEALTALLVIKQAYASHRAGGAWMEVEPAEEYLKL